MHYIYYMQKYVHIYITMSMCPTLEFAMSPYPYHVVSESSVYAYASLLLSIFINSLQRLATIIIWDAKH